MVDSREQLKEYYGKIVQKSDDLQTNACCCGEDSMPAEVRTILRDIDQEITDRFYGCGSPIPPLVEGCTVLDLGCGTGRDVFIMSKLVGEHGRVIGVDMTEEQIDVARRHVPTQTERFGYKLPNVDLRTGYIENLAEIGIADGSIDVVISNCVVNLSPDKPSVFREIFRVLKPGGELFFSDVFAGRRIPVSLQNDPVLHGECLAGAMYIEDFRRLLRDVGCADYRVIRQSPICLGSEEIEVKIGMIDFYSMTVRAFNIPTLEDICEDYGQVAFYRGTIPGQPHYFDLDDHHRFVNGKPMLVCGNTAAMLQETRFSPHFRIEGDRSVHYGPFDCRAAVASVQDAGSNSCGSGCC